MCITTQFIDNDWKLHKKILNFCAISIHDGDDIALILGKCSEDWGLASKLYIVTVDNPVSNNTACTTLICGDLLHVRCIIHKLNLVVWDGLKVVGKSVKHVQGGEWFTRQSPSRLQRFQECAVVEKIKSKASLSLDVPT